MSNTKSETKTLLRVSFAIAIIIFFTATMSDFSVRMFYSSSDPPTKVLAGLLAVLVIASVIMLLMLVIPDLKKPFLRMFGQE